MEAPQIITIMLIVASMAIGIADYYKSDNFERLSIESAKNIALVVLLYVGGFWNNEC